MANAAVENLDRHIPFTGLASRDVGRGQGRRGRLRCISFVLHSEFLMRQKRYGAALGGTKREFMGCVGTPSLGQSAREGDFRGPVFFWLAVQCPECFSDAKGFLGLRFDECGDRHGCDMDALGFGRFKQAERQRSDTALPRLRERKSGFGVVPKKPPVSSRVPALRLYIERRAV